MMALYPVMQDVFQNLETETARKWQSSGIINPLFDGLTYYERDIIFCELRRICPRPSGQGKYIDAKLHNSPIIAAIRHCVTPLI